MIVERVNRVEKSNFKCKVSQSSVCATAVRRKVCVDSENKEAKKHKSEDKFPIKRSYPSSATSDKEQQKSSYRNNTATKKKEKNIQKQIDHVRLTDCTSSAFTRSAHSSDEESAHFGAIANARRVLIDTERHSLLNNTWRHKNRLRANISDESEELTAEPDAAVKYSMSLAERRQVELSSAQPSEPEERHLHASQQAQSAEEERR